MAAASVIGLDAQTGGTIAGFDHLRQSVADILTTRKGTRVMNRNYGSELPALIDAPINQETLLDVYAATAAALDEFEPRFRLTQVQVDAAQSGTVGITVAGHWFYLWPDQVSKFVRIEL